MIMINVMRPSKPKPTSLNLSQAELWQAVLERKADFDNTFCYGVRSTGIYCRPTCPSRRPNQNQVVFFDSAQAAEVEGFRACKRCHPQKESDPVLEKVLRVCRYIETQNEAIPTLSELGDLVEMSPSHLQRVFKQRVGVSPFQYADTLRVERLKQRLREGEAIAPALYDVGYGSSSRLYEKAPEQLGMTPGIYQQAGQNEQIRWAVTPCSLGFLLVAATQRGLCSVRMGNSPTDLEAELHQEFRSATLQPADQELTHWIQSIVAYLRGDLPVLDLPCDVQATAFQRRVWDALKSIPLGTTISYSDLTSWVERPSATRAVARACAINPVALVVPCHRVVAKNGNLAGYRWGTGRKEVLLELEKGYAASERGASEAINSKEL